MASSRLHNIGRFIVTLADDPATDAQLHGRFLADRDESAFAQIVRRHGPMVWGVCRNLLPNEADADDAFQATFLALIRGAKSIRKPETLGAWLHGVAVRVANKLKVASARRTNRERKAAMNEADSPVADSHWDELLGAVHEEVNRLPEGERTAFVLCVLEGVRQPEAAERLGWKPGTLTGRLSKAKQHLLERLTKRGLTPAAALGAVGLGASATSAIVPAAHSAAVLNFLTNAGAVPASILQLSQGVLGMTIAKTKLLAAAVLLAGGLVTGIGASLYSNAEAQAPRPVPAAAPPVSALPASVPPVPVPPATWVGELDGRAARSSSYQTWEYKFVDLGENANRQVTKTTIVEEGKQGWELAAIDRRHDTTRYPGSGFTVAIFKRPAAAIASRPAVGGVASADVAIPLFFQTLVENSGGKENVIDIDKLPQVLKDRQADHVKRAGEGAPEFPKTGKMNYEQFSEWMMAVAKSSYANKTTQPRRTGNPFQDPNALPPAVALPEANPFNLIPTPNVPVVKTPSPTFPPTQPKFVADPLAVLPTKAVLTLHTLSVEGSRSESIAKVLKELIAVNEFEGEVTAAIADDASNSLVVKATETGIKRVTKLVQELSDRAVRKKQEEEKRNAEFRHIEDLRKKP